MNFLTKIVVWISVAMITGLFNCGLALAEGENQQATTSTTVEQDQGTNNQGIQGIIDGKDLTPQAFKADQNN